ncbi:uncharacterized protein LOC101217042 [Cucumis sativus]|uniref:DUF7894 domain-containing protein n=1 Tax=Cucumis sativus TaxID=3659 RepID=A0A0A0K119_CUCSA|nr:uncharacterized protein LOC101217042 [Cucumis sativus]KGN43390.1 hypothetical protein Csa_020179 [Cucumis sativus]
MKLAPKVIFLLRDSEGFASALSGALRLSPPSTVTTLDECFEFSLEDYAIKDQKASGNIVHYLDDKGIYQVSVLILQNYEPPVLACALDVVLSHIAGERSPSSSKAKPTVVVPSVITSSKLKWESKTLTKNDRTVLLYGTEVGPETDISRTMGAKVKKLPSTSQIYYEQLACLYHLIHILNIPAFFVVGLTGRSLSNQAAGEEIQILNEMGELLANSLPLSFSREGIVWNPKETSKEVKEPWRALYG